MRSRLRRASGDAVISAGVLALVVAAIVSIDVRVREQLQVILDGSPSVRGVGSKLGEVGSVLFDAARTQSIEHAPMMLFVVAGTVLLLFLMRS